MPETPETYDNERRVLTHIINSEQAEREKLEEKYGDVWDTAEVQELFEITGFLAPFVSATKRSTGEKGALMFQHSPRFYFRWMPS